MPFRPVSASAPTSGKASTNGSSGFPPTSDVPESFSDSPRAPGAQSAPCSLLVISNMPRGRLRIVIWLILPSGAPEEALRSPCSESVWSGLSRQGCCPTPLEGCDTHQRPINVAYNQYMLLFGNFGLCLFHDFFVYYYWLAPFLNKIGQLKPRSCYGEQAGDRFILFTITRWPKMKRVLSMALPQHIVVLCWFDHCCWSLLTCLST